MAQTGVMDTHRPATSGAPVPPADDLGLTDPADVMATRTTPAPPVVVETRVPAQERVERTVDVHTTTPEPPVVRTVVTGTDAPTRRVEESSESSRLPWLLGGGALATGALATAVTAAVRHVRTPEPTPMERLLRPEAYGPALAALAATVAAAVGLTRSARSRRREDEAEGVYSYAPLVATAETDRRPAVEDAYVPLATDVTDEADDAVETAPVPVEARVLVETLLDPTLFEGRDLPGAAALRAQLPHMRTVADAVRIPADGDAEGIDWLPLVVEAEEDVERAVPHDFTWPVRGHFTHEGQPFELTLVVIDGELGALTVSPDEESGRLVWDEIPTVQTWPGVHQLSFEVDGERR